MIKIPILSHDTLKQYKQIINSIPNLSREEEVKYVLNKNMEMLYTQGLKWAYFYANKFKNRYDIIDLIQQGNLGLWYSIQKFDVTKGIKFITYASLWIRSYIFEYVFKNLSIVSTTSKTLKDKFYNKEVDDLLYEYNNLIQNTANIYLSEFDNEILVSEEDIEKEYILKDKMQYIKNEIDKLDDKNKYIINEIYYKERTLKDIASEFGVSKQAINDKRNRIFNNIRNNKWK